MLSKRIIPCLDVRKGAVVKGIGFTQLKEVGDPVFMARKYYLQGADELCFLDITASYERRHTMAELVKSVAKEIFIPLTAGGGIRSVADMNLLLKSGADKVVVCTAAIMGPGIIRRGARMFGSQCIVVSLDVKKAPGEERWELFVYGGRENTGIDALEFAKRCQELGAGEILLNSLDNDGTCEGYDLAILTKIAPLLTIPVIASSGAGTPKQVLDAFVKGKADAVLAASMFHYGTCSIKQVKDYLWKRGVPVRR